MGEAEVELSSSELEDEQAETSSRLIPRAAISLGKGREVFASTSPVSRFGGRFAGRDHKRAPGTTCPD